MIKNLIKIIEKDGQQLVSARELHYFLENKRHFTDWMKSYISENNDYGFIKNVDFTRIHVGVNPTNGVPIIDYVITIDMAKELSILQRTEKGKEARKYFIQCEKKLKQQPVQPQLPKDYLSALKALVAAEEEKQKLAERNMELFLLIYNIHL